MDGGINNGNEMRGRGKIARRLAVLPRIKCDGWSDRHSYKETVIFSLQLYKVLQDH